MDSAQLLWMRIENAVVGPVSDGVRYNMRTELSSQVAYGVLTAVVGFLPLVLVRLGSSAAMLAILTASSYLGNILASFCLFLTRPGRAKRVVAASWIVSRLMFAAMALVSRDITLLILAALFWLGDQLPLPAYGAIIQSIYPAADRGKVLAMVRLGTTLPILILTPLAGWLLDHAGYRLVFLLAGAAGLLGVALFWRLRVDEAALPVRCTRSLGYAGEILRGDPRFTLYMVGLTVYGLSALIPYPLYPLVQANRLRLSYEDLGWLNLVYGLIRVAFYFFWGRRIDRWGPVRCLQLSFAVSVMTILPYVWAGSGWMLVPSFVAYGISMSAIDLGFISAAIHLADPQRVSEYTALNYTVIGARGMVGPFVGVALLALGMPLTWILLLAAALGLASAGILGAVDRQARALGRADFEPLRQRAEEVSLEHPAQ